MNSQKKVLPFPALLQEPETSTITVQIGNERFAIHYEIEELPPAAPPVLRRQGTKKRATKIVVFPDLPFGARGGMNVWTKRVERKQHAD